MRALVLVVPDASRLAPRLSRNSASPMGCRSCLAENHERPLVRLELRTAWNPSEEPPGKAGLGGFLADLLETRSGCSRSSTRPSRDSWRIAR